ncbi:MAG: hypothetical protein IKW00_08970 [Clostridia bacterium]|nr:hypothetical protein [Clostridia bacterium]
MDSHVYQLISLGARYLFVFLAFLIVFRAGLSLLQEHFKRKKILRNLPDAGMVGEMRDTDNDRAYPLPREGVLGSGRKCDIRLKGLRRRHVNFAFVEGKGLLLTPCHSRSEVLLNSVPIRKGGYALHGAIMQLGGYTLRVRLFAGLNIPRAAAYNDRWQPAYGEELYAPDPFGLTPQPPAELYEQPSAQPEAPVYEAPVYEAPEYAQTMYQAYEQPVYTQPQPVSPEEEEDEPPLPFDAGLYAPRDPQEESFTMTAPRVRHRRSERNRNA